MLSNKEFVAVLLIVIVLICILNACAFGNSVPTTTSYAQLAQQCVSSSTAYICTLYALSTWFFHSNYSEPRQHIRIVFLGMLVVMMIGQVAVLVLNLRAQYYSRVNDTLDIREIHSDFDMSCRVITLVLTILTFILLAIVFVYLALVTHRKRKEHMIRRDNMY